VRDAALQAHGAISGGCVFAHLLLDYSHIAVRLSRALSKLAIPVHALRKYLSWIFALTFFIGLPITFTTTLNIVGSLRHRDPTVQWSLEWQLLLVILQWVMPIQTAVFGAAWWTTFREKRSARVWGIAASAGYLAMALFPLAFPPHSFFTPLSPVLALGIVGVLAFAWPAVTPDAMPPTSASPISRDGTSNFLNTVCSSLPCSLTMARTSGG